MTSSVGVVRSRPLGEAPTCARCDQTGLVTHQCIAVDCGPMVLGTYPPR
jgi:hypothetical protein